MNDPNTSEALDYPWYQAGNWTVLEQGDLLPNCPVLISPANLTAHLLKASEGDKLEIAQQVQFADLIIVSQSCDLFNDKIEQVLLCGHFPASNHGRDARISISKEQRPALHMIEKCELSNHQFERRVVDFRTIYTLPKAFVLAFASTLSTLETKLLDVAPCGPDKAEEFTTQTVTPQLC